MLGVKRGQVNESLRVGGISKGLLAKNRRYAKNPLIQPRRAGIVGLKAGLRRFTLT
jgi:hypothetical protein